MRIPTMRNIRLLVSYDGTEFSGWQLQSNTRSVQGVLEDAVSSLVDEPVRIIGAGRTDSGVHATGQVCNFYTSNTGIPDERYAEALNTRLPPDLRVLSSHGVPDVFHSRRDACFREYEYRFTSGPTGFAHLERFTWRVKRMPSLSALNDIAREICGTHDFTTFAAAGDTTKTRVRRINHAVFLSNGPCIQFRINGNAFLWRMVRSLLGTMIHLALRGGGAAEMRAILEKRDRALAGPTAPPRGLFFTRVGYEEE